MSVIHNAHLFCRVIDNFGDIGVCWRLARQMQAEHGVAVTLWVDNLNSFHRLCPSVNVEQRRQQVAGVEVRHWTENDYDWENEAVPDLVIEAFACDLPPGYIRSMANRSRKPVWINLEYLSAERWIQDCHQMPSPHPQLALTKYFFFPGFSPATGGLLLERDLLSRREQFQSNSQARQAYLAKLGVLRPDSSLLISLFCYPTAPVLALFEAFARGPVPVTCMVPQGVATEQLSRFFSRRPETGAEAVQGNVTVKVIPFLPQHDYDQLLWTCDLNFVRGEDSLVRAIWAGRPFIWNIYPQLQDAHKPKLDAFLQCYASGLQGEAAERLSSYSQSWNGLAPQGLEWAPLHNVLPELDVHAVSWAEGLHAYGDLATKLLRFAEKIG